ncbi:MAG: ethanolamine ammonia-lyase reactivating factor EutA [Candidatus Thorarchaeota archaeon]|nr:ethanolamine ammonia-lyase reactivating factor EutA [Candidatus Thorarchaeota archaeon]
MMTRVTRKELISVGIDIGTTTSHLVFSRLVLQKDTERHTERFVIKEREVIHQGPVHLTPFLNPATIDLQRLRELFLADYAAADLSVLDVDTGAVIVTGETARKQNAQEIVALLAGESGRFVAATAGPNFEAVVAAHGSGAVTRSRETGRTIMNVDVGGGSSNIAVCRQGRVVDTAAVNVGGRLLAVDDKNHITRLEETGRLVSEAAGFKVHIGMEISEDVKKKVSSFLADSLMEAMRGTAQSQVTRMLMMTPPLKLTERIDDITFSGGVAEYIYRREEADFGDLGRELARAITVRTQSLGYNVIEPDHRIRATVIGAGQSSLQVSGSTTFLSEGLVYPLRNLPAVVPRVPRAMTSPEQICTAITDALKQMDLEEGVDDLILAFNDAVRPSYDSLTSFAKGVLKALPKTVSTGRPIMMCFDEDIGNSVGNVMKRETGLTNHILSIDEVSLQQGDFVDIGEPIIEGVVVPVIVKTLVFDR